MHGRRILGQGLAGGAAALFFNRGLLAEELAPTPRLTEGPYYPDRFPLDTDNELLVVNDGITPRVSAQPGGPARPGGGATWARTGARP